MKAAQRIGVSAALLLLLVCSFFIGHFPQSSQSQTKTHIISRLLQYVRENNEVEQQLLDPNEPVVRGYLRSVDNYCAYATKNRTLWVEPCRNLSAVTALATFSFTQWGHLQVAGQCVTQPQRDGQLYLAPCVPDDPAQQWYPPNKDNFVQSVEVSVCLAHSLKKRSQHQQLIAKDCWGSCPITGFRDVTWWVVGSPQQKPSEREISALNAKLKEPWQDRYCLHKLGGPQP